MQFMTLIAPALAVSLAAAVPQTPPTYHTPTYTNSTGIVPTYGHNSTTPSHTYGTAAPSGTKPTSTPSSPPGYEQANGAGKAFGSMAAMGLVLAGGVALVCRS